MLQTLTPEEEEAFREKGTCVFELTYEGDYPGSSGCYVVYELNGQFWPDNEEDEFPAYTTLLEALEASELNNIGDAIKDITCTAMSTPELASHITSYTEVDINFNINGIPHLLPSGATNAKPT